MPARKQAAQTAAQTPAKKRAAPKATEADIILNSNERLEEVFISYYFSQLLNNTNPNSRTAYAICSFCEYNFNGLEGFPHSQNDETRAYPSTISRDSRKVKAQKEHWQALKDHFESTMDFDSLGPVDLILVQNLHILCEELRLEDYERDLLQFLLIAGKGSFFDQMAMALSNNDPMKLAAFTARLIGHEDKVGEISKALKDETRLYDFDIIYRFFTPDGKLVSPFPVFGMDVQRLLHSPHMTRGELTETLIGTPRLTDLSLADFSSRPKEIAIIRDVIKAAVVEQRKGINIMLYGPVGGGKTELAKALAKDLGLTIYAVGEEKQMEEEGDKNKQTVSQFRMSRLAMAQNVLEGQHDRILLLDEAEDVLRILANASDNKGNTNDSKVLTNRTLEQNPIVTLWTANDTDSFHPSILDRFTYALHVNYPPASIREKTWESVFKKHGLALSKEDSRHLSRMYDTAPRQIENAAKVAALSGHAEREVITATLEAGSRIKYGSAAAIQVEGGLSEFFDPELLNIPTEKQNKFGAIFAAAANRPYALFIQANLGAGVKTLTNYVAEHHEMPVAFASLKDIEYDPTRPHTSRKFLQGVKGIFDKARDYGAYLYLQDMDCMMIDPRSADSEWDVETLRSVQNMIYDHKLPMIAGTFRADVKIPVDVTESFSLAMNIKPLSQELCAKAHKIYLGKEWSGEKPFPDNLVPADFSIARKTTKMSLNGEATETDILRILERQPERRQVQMRQRIGFGARGF